MQAFKGLVFKELKISMNIFLTMICLPIIISVGSFGFSRYFNEPMIFASVSIGLLGAHSLYIPIFLLSSLQIEGRTQLWLHNPQNAVKLLLAKLSTSIVYYLISILCSILIASWSISRAEAVEDITVGFKGLLLIGAGILVWSIYAGIWMFFYWTVYHSLSKITWIKKIRPFMIGGIWIAINIIGTYIRSQPFYVHLKESWVIHIDGLKSLSITIGSLFIDGKMDTLEFSLVNLIIYILIAITVLLISVWLLERKVEV